MAAARILCRKTASLTLHGSVALRMYSLSSIDHRTYRNHVLIQTAARVAHRHGERAREYTDEAKVSGRSTSRWRLYKYLILFGVPGGLVFYVSCIIQGRRKGRKLGTAAGMGNHPHRPGEGVGGVPLSRSTSQGVWGSAASSPTVIGGGAPEANAFCRKTHAKSALIM